ncbi:MAG: UPF0175 family protein [Verrucomicrobiaceae bacterium]|nr:UPF0175 family protein [Verrucomicrobiaceae bacterium]
MIEVPDVVAQRMHLDGPKGRQRTLEGLAIQGYNAGELTHGQVGAMLGLEEFNEIEKFLKDNGAASGMTSEDYISSLEAIQKLRNR